MDLFGSLLGSGGCAVDGSTTRNPIANMADSLFDSMAVSTGMHDFQSAQAIDQSEIMAVNYAESQYQQYVPSTNYEYNSMVDSFHSANISDPSQYMMMASMGAMMQSRHASYMYSQQQVNENMVEDSSTSTSKEMEISREEQEAAAFKIYDQIFQGNGATSEQLKSMTVEDQNLLLGGLYSSNSKVSWQGNDQAWQNIAYNLETKMREYVYKSENACDREVLDGLFDKGMSLFKAGEVGEALLVFESVSKRASNAPESWRMLGMCHCEMDNDKLAIECFKRAVEMDPFNIEALRDLGTSYVNELNSVRALETLRAWITHNPRYVGLEVHADAHGDGSLMDEVMHLIIEAEAFAPDDPDVLVVLGVLCNVSMDYSYAVGCFERASTLRPSDYTILNKLGATLANANKGARALPIYQQALQLRPKYARGWLNLGIAYFNVGQHKDSIEAYLQALRLSPDAKHIWGYLRSVLANLNRMDLVEMSGRENVEELSIALKSL